MKSLRNTPTGSCYEVLSLLQLFYERPVEAWLALDAETLQTLRVKTEALACWLKGVERLARCQPAKGR